MAEFCWLAPFGHYAESGGEHQCEIDGKSPSTIQKISWGTLAKIGVPSGRKQRGDLHVGFDETDAKSGGAGLGLAIRFGLRGG